MGLDTFRERRQARRLSGTDRAGSWARDEARRRQRRYLRRRWRAFGGAFAGWLVLIAAATAFLPNDLLRGMFIGGGVVAGLSTLWFLLVQLTGTAGTMMGDSAEQWTAQELHSLKTSGWRLINHFALGHADIDHLLVGPGGVFVLETKWSPTSWSAPWMMERQRSAARQAALSARQVSLWPPFRSLGLQARPVVVLWSSDTSGTKGGWSPSDVAGQPERVVDGVVVLSGKELRPWLIRQPSSDLSDAVETMWPAVLEQVRVRDEYEARTSPVPMSAFDLSLRVIVSVICALLAALLIIYPVQWTNSLWPGVASAALTIGGGVAVARWRPSVRWLAMSCSIGGALTVLAIVGLIINGAIRSLAGGV